MNRFEQTLPSKYGLGSTTYSLTDDIINVPFDLKNDLVKKVLNLNTNDTFTFLNLKYISILDALRQVNRSTYASRAIDFLNASSQPTYSGGIDPAVANAINQGLYPSNQGIDPAVANAINQALSPSNQGIDPSLFSAIEQGVKSLNTQTGSQDFTALKKAVEEGRPVFQDQVIASPPQYSTTRVESDTPQYANFRTEQPLQISSLAVEQPITTQPNATPTKQSNKIPKSAWIIGGVAVAGVSIIIYLATRKPSKKK